MFSFAGMQKLTLLDYPDRLACILFTRGCNLRCPFCHNAILVNDKVNNSSNENINEQEIYRYLEKRRNVLSGVVISGGEPLMHEDIYKVAEKIHSMGYMIKLDTNGTYPDRLKYMLDKQLIDYVAMDVKQCRQRYFLACGVKNEDIANRVNESLNILKGGKVTYELRTTLVKGIHTEKDIRELGQWIKGSMMVYLQNYKNSGRVLKEEGLSPFSEKSMNSFLCIIKETNPNSKIR